MPMIVSIVITVIQLSGVIRTNFPYKERVISASVFIMFAWIVLFVVWSRRIKTNEKRRNELFVIAMEIILSFCVGICFSCFIWGESPLSLYPINEINEGIRHKDNLFHSAVAESFGRSIIPSALVNAETPFHYHTFSHFLIKIIGRLISVPVFLVYNYIYPVLFLPLYVFAQILSIKCAKSYFVKNSFLHLADYIIIGIYNIGIFRNEFLSGCGIWKSSYIGSESFLIGNTLAYLAYAGIFCYMQKINKNKWLDQMVLLVYIPSMIFGLSWAKISIGFLFSASIMYYVVRIHWKNVKAWVIAVFYGMIFLICLNLFNRGQETFSDIRSSFHLFAFMNSCSSTGKFVGHYLILSLMGGLFIAFEMRFRRYHASDILKGKTLWIEEVLIICILGFLPGLIMNINGGSAVYFSYAVETISLILLCGNNFIPQLFGQCKGEWKRALEITLFLWCVHIGIIDAISIIDYPAYSSKKVVQNADEGFYWELMKLREMMSDEPEAYTFYLESDVRAGQVFQSPLASIYVYPGLTGAGVINASYCDSGKYFMYDGTEIQGYGLDDVDNGRLSYSEALEKAREMGKRYVIHVFGNGYEIDELDKME